MEENYSPTKVLFTTKISHLDNVIVVNDINQMRRRLSELYLRCGKDYQSYIAIDGEFNELDAYINDPLLFSFGIPEVQIVVDVTSVNLLDILPTHYQTYIYIGQNIKIDYQFLKIKCGVELTQVYDTMVADQKIWQNSGHRFSLDEICMRHLKFLPKNMDKEYRMKFVGVNPTKYIPVIGDIDYASSDIEFLHRIKEKQEVLIKKYELDWWLNTIEFKLPIIIGNMELQGFDFDRDKWVLNVKDAEERLYQCQCKLDDCLRKHFDNLLSNDETILASGQKFTAKRNKKEVVIQQDLFGSEVINKTKPSIGNVNYNSPVQIMDVFSRLKQPLPTKEGKYLIPLYKDVPVEKTNKVTKELYTVFKTQLLKHTGLLSIGGKEISHLGFTTESDSIAKYLIDIPDSPIQDFLELLVEHGKILKEISTYGYSFIQKLNPITGKLHSTFRQSATANSRLSSGGGNKQPDKPNFQNIPRDNKFRNCFLADKNGDWVCQTIDLSGAEVTIICDKANDDKLYGWAVKNDDAHSPIVTNSWRYIFLYRAGLEAKKWNDFYGFLKGYNSFLREYTLYNGKEFTTATQDLYNQYRTFTVSKKENKPYRQAGKNCTFGSLYQMKAKKAAETYNGTTTELRKINPNAEPVNITEEEGKVALWAIKQAIPKSFSYIENTIATAFKQGYLVLNNRSKSRVWFAPVVRILQACKLTIDELKEQGINAQIASIDNGVYTLTSNDSFNLDWKDLKEISGQAANLTISGTQADMVKEAMVVIHTLIKKYNLPNILLLQVHDELCYKIPKKNLDDVIPSFVDDETEIEWKENKLTEFVPYVMSQVANRFLDHVTMGAEAVIEPFWTK